MIRRPHNPRWKPPTGARINHSHRLARGLVFCMPFNEGAGNIAHDASLFGNHGTLTNMAAGAAWTAGQLGPALTFDGVNDHVVVTDRPAIQNVYAGGGSVIAWVRTNGLQSQTRIYNKSANDDGDTVKFNFNNILQFRQNFTTTRGRWETTAGIANAALTMIAVTYDSGSASNNPIFYVDGLVAASSQTQTPVGTVINNAGNNLFIGCDKEIIAYKAFNGDIALVQFYNRIITPDEVRELFVNPFAIFSGTSFHELPLLEDAGGPVTNTGSTNLDALIQKTDIASAASLDGLLQKSLSAQTAINALVQKTGITQSVSLDALLQRSLSATLSIDAQIGSAIANLLAAYSLSENTGTSTADDSGNGNTGSISGATWSTGKYGAGLTFDGINDYMDTTLSVDLTGAFTFCAWVRTAADYSAANDVLIGARKVAAGARYAQLKFGYEGGANPQNGGYIEVRHGSTISQAISTTSGLNDNAWHFFAGGRNASNQLFISIDNQTIITGDTETGTLDMGVAFYVGANNFVGTAEDFFDGRLDEIRIYDKALNQTEIGDAMNTPLKAGSTPIDVSLDALLQRTGITATTSVDAAISKSFAATVSADALIQAVLSGQISIDSLIQASNSINVSIDSLLQSQDISATTALEALVRDSLSAIVSLDAVLTGGSSASVALDSLLRGGKLAPISIDAALQQAGITTTVSVDSLLQSAGLSVNTAVDAVLTGGAVATVGLDSLLQVADVTASTVLGALLQTQAISATVVVDALIQAGKSATVSIDAVLTGALGTNASVNLDALLSATQSANLSIDSLLQAQDQSATASLNAVLQQLKTVDVSLDSMIQASNSANLSIDSLLQVAALSATVDLSALLQQVKSGTVSIDAILVTLASANVSLDGLLLGLRSSTLSIDAIIGIITQVINNARFVDRSQRYRLVDRTGSLKLRKLN